MCCYLGFVVLFIEHRQSRLSIIHKGLKVSGMEMNIGFNLKSLAVLALNKRVSLSFEALKPEDFSSLAMKALDGIFFQCKAVLSTLKIYCSVELPS